MHLPCVGSEIADASRLAVARMLPHKAPSADRIRRATNLSPPEDGSMVKRDSEAIEARSANNLPGEVRRNQDDESVSQRHEIAAMNVARKRLVGPP